MDTPSITQLQKAYNYNAFFDSMIARMYRHENYVRHPSGWTFTAHDGHAATAAPPGYNINAACYSVEGAAAAKIVELLQDPPTPPNQDPLVTIVYDLAARRMRPEAGIEKINEIVQQAIRGALVETLPKLAFQADGENGECK